MTSYIFNLSVFKTKFFIIFYYYIWKGGAQTRQFSASASLWGKKAKAKANQKSLLLIAEKENVKLNPWYITGFVDGEGCFQISILKNENLKVGWTVRLVFTIGLHEKDKAILIKIIVYFRVGQIYKHGPKSVQLKVSSMEEIEKLIEHLDKYFLITQKRSDYELWKKAFVLIKNKEHLTIEGLKKIVAIRASLNYGLSPELSKAFPKITSIKRPLVNNQRIEDPNWLAGFASAEGCFYINILKSQSSSIGFQVILVYVITQHIRDEMLIIRIRDYLNCGNISKYREAFYLRVSKFDDIVNIIIPFFKKYPIRGVKEQDFRDWCKVAELMKNKAHLTKDGLNKISIIKAGINLGRFGPDALSRARNLPGQSSKSRGYPAGKN